MEEMFKTASETLKIDLETVRANYKKIEGRELCYFWAPVRGGLHMLIAENGEKLAATSIVSFDQLLAAYDGGKRN